jgi:hypothetical protein
VIAIHGDKGCKRIPLTYAGKEVVVFLVQMLGKKGGEGGFPFFSNFWLASRVRFHSSWIGVVGGVVCSDDYEEDE